MPTKIEHRMVVETNEETGVVVLVDYVKVSQPNDKGVIETSESKHRQFVIRADDVDVVIEGLLVAKKSMKGWKPRSAFVYTTPKRGGTAVAPMVIDPRRRVEDIAGVGGGVEVEDVTE